MSFELKKYILEKTGLSPERNHITYREDKNNDALTNEWLEQGTSWVYKVGVITVIDANKCDWVYFAVGIQKYKDSNVDVIGHFGFANGENDDIGRVLERAMELLKSIHPVFEP